MRSAAHTDTTRLLLVVALVGVLVSLAVTAARAEVVQGPCDGEATFSDGATIVASESLDQAVEIPESDTVAYDGVIDVTPAEDAVVFDGEVLVSLPVGNWSVASWTGETTQTTVSGTYTYDAPSWVPRGSGPVPLEVTHTHGDVVCRADLRVAVAGSPWTLASALMLGGTVVFGIATIAAGAKDDRGKGHPVVGLVTGFVFGLLGAGSSFTFGGIALDSPMFLVLPVAGLVLGVLMGVWAPFGTGAAAGPMPPVDRIDVPDLTASGTAGGTPTDGSRSSGAGGGEP